MTFREKLLAAAGSRGLGLCVGLDPDPKRLPPAFSPDIAGISAFLLLALKASVPFAAAYKVNTAFFEALGWAGWQLLEEVAYALPPQAIRIADAKRGDIGNTAQRYAEAFLQRLPFDALTVNPYLGGDSLEPFISDASKGAYVLALTTNPGAKDLQFFADGKERLYQRVLSFIPTWAPQGNLGAVVGATHPAELLAIRERFPDIPLLIPGLGAQGGDIAAIRSMPCGGHYAPVLINVSRAILYPEGSGDPEAKISAACKIFRDQLGLD